MLRRSSGGIRVEVESSGRRVGELWTEAGCPKYDRISCGEAGDMTQTEKFSERERRSLRGSKF